jgi:hypothetical protein
MTPASYRDVAILSLQRATGSKPGALSILKRDDVKFTAGVLHVNIRRAGESSWILVMPDDDNELCAIRALREYLAAVDGPRSGPLFRSSRTKSGALTEKQLTRQGIGLVLKDAAKLAGMPFERLGGQSIRLGRVGETVAHHGANHHRIAQDVGYTETRHLTPFISTINAEGERVLDRDVV